MSLKEQLYKFGNLDPHAAVIMQQAIELRKDQITHRNSDAMKGGDKVLKAVINELDQMFDDLDRHMGAQIRIQELSKMGKDVEARDQAFKNTIGE